MRLGLGFVGGKSEYMALELEEIGDANAGLAGRDLGGDEMPLVGPRVLAAVAVELLVMPAEGVAIVEVGVVVVGRNDWAARCRLRAKAARAAGVSRRPAPVDIMKVATSSLHSSLVTVL